MGGRDWIKKLCYISKHICQNCTYDRDTGDRKILKAIQILKSYTSHKRGKIRRGKMKLFCHLLRICYVRFWTQCSTRSSQWLGRGRIDDNEVGLENSLQLSSEPFLKPFEIYRRFLKLCAVSPELTRTGPPSSHCSGQTIRPEQRCPRFSF